MSTKNDGHYFCGAGGNRPDGLNETLTLIWCSLGKPGTIPTKLKKMRENVKQFILPEKRKRPKKRTVRISKTQYPVHLKHLK
ncbi:hypothetical protein E2R62_25520 [Citrobacter rodentium]|uniref:Copper resistance protein n=1 Tax=Citrobacter rodentium TaxID=67825 RepID=A0A482PLX6_CITRO|nr:hypothetical protein E2R62_25520 [Citrobacter rodentium]